VFSGNKQYTNQPGCTDVPNHGAIPAGTYWIVDRPSGGLKSQTITFIKDIVTNVDHNSWFALYRDDGTVNDRTWINGIMRGQFRLHPIGPLGLSEGCVTFFPKRIQPSASCIAEIENSQSSRNDITGIWDYRGERL